MDDQRIKNEALHISIVSTFVHKELNLPFFEGLNEEEEKKALSLIEITYILAFGNGIKVEYIYVFTKKDNKFLAAIFFQNDNFRSYLITLEQHQQALKSIEENGEYTEKQFN